MIKIRRFRNDDASVIVRWIKSDEELRKWSADVYAGFPLSGTDIVENYRKMSSDGDFVPYVLAEDDVPVAHFILRREENNAKCAHLGFVIVDCSLRGKGLGKSLLAEAVEMARSDFGADSISLHVYENNVNAFACYRNFGFTETERKKVNVAGYDWTMVSMEYKF